MTLQSYTNGKSCTSNGNGAARPTVSGRSMAHRLSASQRAVLVANIDDGIVSYQPTQAALAKDFGVSVPMVQKAKRLSPLARQHVLSGEVTVGFYAKQAPRPALPKSDGVEITDIKVIDVAVLAANDAIIREIITVRGVDAVIDIAAAIEAAQ